MNKYLIRSCLAAILLFASSSCFSMTSQIHPLEAGLRSIKDHTIYILFVLTIALLFFIYRSLRIKKKVWGGTI